MPIVDSEALPEIQMRAGISGRWLCGRQHGTSNVAVLRNWIEPGITVPRHTHDAEEIVLVEHGRFWAEIDGVRHEAGPGDTVIIPARAVHAWGTFDGKAQVLFVWPMADPFAPDKSKYLEGEPPAVV